MSILNKLGFGRPASSSDTTPIPNNVVAPDFVMGKFGESLLTVVYSKIMAEAADRASLPAGVDKEPYTLTVYDSVSPAKRGLVSVLVSGMVKRNKKFFRVDKTKRGDLLFIEVHGTDSHDGAGNVKPGIMELDFTGFRESEVLALLFEVLGLITQAVGNATAISQAAIIKIHELSQMIANEQNLEPLTAQIRQLNESITKGRAGVIDAQSSIEFAKVDTKPGSDAAAYIYSMIGTITGIPASYLFGEVAGGLGDQSTGDEKRLNAAIRRYFHSILSGALYAAWGKTFQYKTLIDDLPSLVELFTWLETTTMITEDGKKRLLLDNTALNEDEIDTTEPEPAPPPVTVPGQSLTPPEQQAQQGDGVA